MFVSSAGTLARYGGPSRHGRSFIACDRSYNISLRNCLRPSRHILAYHLPSSPSSSDSFIFLRYALCRFSLISLGSRTSLLYSLLRPRLIPFVAGSLILSRPCINRCDSNYFGICEITSRARRHGLQHFRSHVPPLSPPHDQRLTTLHNNNL